MFLDEDPKAPVAQTPPSPPVQGGPAHSVPPQGGPGWHADPAHQSGSAGTDAGPVSWGTDQAAAGPAAQPPAPAEGGYGYPRVAPPATPSSPGPNGYPEKDLPSAPGGYGYPHPAQSASAAPPSAAPAGENAVPWQRQVQDLARQDGSHAGPGTPGSEAQALPWRPPPANDPFASAAEPARPAGLGRRLIARLIDSLLVGAVVSGATYPLALSSLHHLQDKIDAARLSGENVRVWLIDGTTGLYLGAALAGLLLAGLLYEVLPTVKWGRTLGKKLLRLRVLDIESQLNPGFGQALRRMLIRQILDFVAIGVLNSLWCVFDRPWRQCWHDKTARTFVATD
jgi:uncharacterized RDD family membrane protein YckC